MEEAEEIPQYPAGIFIVLFLSEAVLIHLSADPRCFHTCCVWSFNRIRKTTGSAGRKLSQPHTDSRPPPRFKKG